MIAGHFGFAAAVKAKSPATPLWVLMLACQWLDVVFVVLYAAGLERLEPLAGAAQGAYGAVIIHADYDHSLVGAAVLALLFGLLAAVRYGRRSGVVLGLVVFSHWILDLLVHRHDMPLLPGATTGPHFGLGLWQYPLAAALLELALVIAGGALYWRAARSVAAANPLLIKRANLSGGVVLGSGLLTLGLNVLGF